MHVTLGLRVARSNLPAERLDQRDRRIAGAAYGNGQFVEIEQLGAAALLDISHDLLRDQADSRLRPSQRSLEIEHALHPAFVRENVAHIGLREIGIKQLIARSVHINAPD
ncbi:hypothetical protein ALO94_201003 [Pseudomonas syringae pv. spinaceae]|uniref:Uncharacterized protein n=1 Tax=Pseudomonas syringae pv. spinaceae TaxID=264459 RepID=A0A0Q0BEM7_PSESX|nr:hypothetical protein ALO94_201003 [Pseudomonas syringae pv. spinaceae]